MSERFFLSRWVIRRYTGLDVSFLSCLLIPKLYTSPSLFIVRYWELIHYPLKFSVYKGYTLRFYTPLCAECIADHPSYMSRSGFSQPSTTGSLFSSFSMRGKLWGSHSILVAFSYLAVSAESTTTPLRHLKKSRFFT